MDLRQCARLVPSPYPARVRHSRREPTARLERLVRDLVPLSRTGVGHFSPQISRTHPVARSDAPARSDELYSHRRRASRLFPSRRFTQVGLFSVSHAKHDAHRRSRPPPLATLPLPSRSTRPFAIGRKIVLAIVTVGRREWLGRDESRVEVQAETFFEPSLESRRDGREQVYSDQLHDPTESESRCDLLALARR